MASFFEGMGSTYTLGTDGMYYPDLELPEEETPQYASIAEYAILTSGSIRKHIMIFTSPLVEVNVWVFSAFPPEHLFHAGRQRA